MTVDIRDVETVRAIQPPEVALYLRANGWEQAHTNAGRSSTWRLSRDGEFEALLPLNAETPDYALRMGELLSVLAVAEGRSKVEVYEDLLSGQMRERASVPEFELSGPVVRLDRAEGTPRGRVTIVGIVDDRQVRVGVELEDGPYHEAVRAHDQGKTIRLSGTLVREGRGSFLQNPAGIVVE